MVTLHEVEAHQFFTLKNFKVSMNVGGLIMVCGQNGSGKTAGFIESVRYGLYGTSFEYGARPGGQVWNRFASEEGYVSIRLQNSDGFYRLYRHGKNSGSTELDLFKETEDGKEVKISRGTNAQTQKFITENVLGMSEWLFCNSVIFSTDLMKFPDLSDADRKALFDEILETAVFTSGFEVSKKALDESLILLEQIKFKRKVAAESIIIPRETKDEVDLEAMDVETTISRLNAEISGLLSNIDTLKGKYQKLRDELSLEQKDLRQYKDTISKLVSKRSGLKARSEALEEQYEAKSNLIKSGRCSKCGQTTDSLELSKDHEIAEIAEMVQKISKTILTHDGGCQDIIANIEKYETAITKTSRSISSLEGQRNVLEVELKSMTKREIAVEAAKVASEKAAELRQNLMLQVQKFDQEADTLQKVVDDERVMAELFGSKGARINVINSVLPSLNQEADQVAAIMHTPIQVQFSVRGPDESYAGTLSASVYNPLGAGQYRGNSAGERGRADVIIMMSLLAASTARISGKFNHAFFDEAFEKLDKSGQRAVLSVLRYITKGRASVFMINHSAHELNSEVDQVWNMEKGILTQ